MNISRRFLSFGIAITLIVALTNFIPPSASAIENGTDATGSSFVVPIRTSEGNFCSGALISAWIVATAGHCVLDSDGLVNYVTPVKVTIGDYLTTWINDIHASQLKPTTLHSYKRVIDAYLIPGLGLIKLQDLRPSHIQTFYHLVTCLCATLVYVN